MRGDTTDKLSPVLMDWMLLGVEIRERAKTAGAEHCLDQWHTPFQSLLYRYGSCFTTFSAINCTGPEPNYVHLLGLFLDLDYTNVSQCEIKLLCLPFSLDSTFYIYVVKTRSKIQDAKKMRL
jgi:hypothetical protein